MNHMIQLKRKRQKRKNNHMCLILLYLLMVATSSVAQPDSSIWKPVHYSKWEHITDKNKRSALFGREVQNFKRTDGNWQQINNNWVNYGDSLFVVDDAVLQTAVKNDGSSALRLVMADRIYSVDQRLDRLVLLRSTDWEWNDIYTLPDWGDITVERNNLFWRNVFPQVDYHIIKTNGKVEHRIYFHPGFLDTVITLYNQRDDSASLYLANLIEYSFSSNIDDADIFPCNRERSILKQIGRSTFSIDRQQLFYPGWDTLPAIPVFQRWIKVNGRVFCIEAVSLSAVKKIHEQYPDSTISHNDSQTFDENSCEDTFVNSQLSTHNYGVYNNYLRLTAPGYAGFRKFDLSGITGTVFVDSTELKVVFNNNQDSCLLGYMITDWDEGNVNAGAIDAVGEHGANWEKAKDSLGTAGDWGWAGNTFSTADYNDRSGSGYGKVQAGPGSLFGYLSVGQESTGNNSKLVSDWINGVIPNYGHIYIEFDASAGSFRPREFTPSGYQPSLYVEWTVLTSGINTERRRTIILKGDSE